MTGSTKETGRPAVIRCPLCQSLNRVDLARLDRGPVCGTCQRPLLLDRPIAVTDEDFERVVRETEVPVMVDFYADWCGPCRVVAPVLEELSKEYAGKLNIYKVDTDKEQELAAMFGIRSIPSILFVPKEGQPQMAMGALPKDALKDAISSVLLTN